MTRMFLLAVTMTAGLAIAGVPTVSYLSDDAAAATQATKKTSTKKQTSKKKTQTKKSYCGYPAPPNPAGMSDYCSYMYNIYCKRGVGCNKYGRDFTE